MSKNDPFVVRQTTFADIPDIVQMTQAASVNDPLMQYLRETPDAGSGLFSQALSLELMELVGTAVRKGHARSIGESDALVTYDPAIEALSSHDDNMIKITGEDFQRSPTKLPLFSPEQQSRRIDYERKYDELVEATLGPRRHGMYSLSILATDPKKQGRGYASSLVREVLRLADERGRDAWVISSNRNNTDFYRSLGFVSQAKLVLGEDNPTWDRPPVVCPLMVRAVQTLHG